MLALVVTVFLSTISFLTHSAVPSAESVCVLNFERAEHPYTRAIEKIFGQLPRSRGQVFHTAGPMHFMECLKNGASEIVIVAHALEMEKDSGRYNLGYYRKMSAQDKEKLKKQMLQAGHAKRVAQVDWAKDLYFPPQPILPKIFERAYAYLKALPREQIKLKRIRLVSCEPEAIVERYEALTELIEDFEIQIQMAPTDFIGGLIHGKNVTKLDEWWLAESAQFREQGKKYFYAYINLDTYVLYRGGETYALRGKYQIEINGMAVGLASQWSVIFVDWDDVKDLAVGESRSLLSPHLDLSLALGPNVEMGLSPTPHLKTPTETNSIGFKIGIFSHMEITRMY